MSTPVQVYDPNTQSKIGASGQTIASSATPPFEPFWVYYTGISSNAAAASRSLINADITVGSAVCFDCLTATGTPAAASGNFPGDRLARFPGFDVTQPQTSLLNQFAGIVTKVPDGSVRGGPIQIAAAGVLQCRTTSGGAIAPGDVYTIANGSFILVAISTLGTASVGSAAANQTGVLDIIRQAIAQQLQPQTGAITDQLNTALVGPCMRQVI